MANHQLIVALLLAGAGAFAPRHGLRQPLTPAKALLSQQTGESPTNTAVLERFLALPNLAPCVQCEYIWIDADGKTRSKTRTVEAKKTIEGASGLPNWTYDGSSTGQAPGDDSEVILKPKAVFPDPFRPVAAGEDNTPRNLLVLCDTWTAEGDALPTNDRAAAAEIFAAHEGEKPWFGIEQEYTLFNMDQTTPLGWPAGGYPGPQGPYYCSAGAGRAFGRAVSEAHYKACLYAGIAISGTNAEVMPGQWEYQVGPSVGIAAGDELWASRYILDRVCEEFNVHVTYEPKPIKGDWNGAGAHINFSTEKMREAGGIEEIVTACEKLRVYRAEHIAIYGENNEERLTGAHETCSIDQFKWGVADRGCSIRIPRDTHAALCGYLEDRRPASNVDPYRATAKIMASTMDGVDVSDAVAAVMPLFAKGTVAPDGAAIEEAVAKVGASA